MSEQLSPEGAIRLLRAKAAELEHRVLAEWDDVDQPATAVGLNMAFINLCADIALVMALLAEHIERSEQRWGNQQEIQGHVIRILEAIAGEGGGADD